ncbi:MAG TPA: HepT-like ribonuclease domain-containing protein [Thermoanaerobaculia bacterium]|nr:HepT-like ribonuclease domain-containing protein [Thermoanaerobaculia bacterium]
MILGEAVVQLSKVSPDLAQRIPQQRGIIDFRNLLIHGYAAVVDELVWGILQEDVPALRARVAQLLEDLDARQ